MKNPGSLLLVLVAAAAVKLVALVAQGIPIPRAMRVDPTVALRQDLGRPAVAPRAGSR